ncbi:MAG: hypothetical protein ACRET6_08910 [Burkholderiales bacterium]
MSSDVSLHVLYKVANAPVSLYPFPHIYVKDVFPPDYYRQLRDHLPPPEAYKDLKALRRTSDNYPDTRLVMPVRKENIDALAEPIRGFWDGLARWLLGGFGETMLAKFGQFLDQRFGDSRNMQYYDEALIVQDYTTYSLGPHTDSPSKVLSLLFYLPPDDVLAHLGTSIYVPKDPNFICPGGPHHPFERFERMVTMPYVPNSLFAFVKTSKSFHGVEPIKESGIRRDLLLYDIKVQNPSELKQQAQAAAPAAAPASKFTF